jgi:hypothetical protein
MSVDVDSPGAIPDRAGRGPAGKYRRLPRYLRRPAIALTSTACALAISLGAATAAQAQVNPKGPNYPFAWGDCWVDVGNVASTGGVAVGGVDIYCGHYYDITAHIYLYRWNINAKKWVLVGTGGGAGYNYQLSVQTSKPYCGGGKTYWNDVASVNIDGYSKTFNLDNALGYPPRYAPGWAPGC